MNYKIFVFRLLGIVVAIASALSSVRANSVLASAPFVQYTSNSGLANPTCTAASGTCSEVIPGTSCLVSVSRNGSLITSSYQSRKGGSSDPGPCGSLNTHNNTMQVGSKNIITTSQVVLQ